MTPDSCWLVFAQFAVNDRTAIALNHASVGAHDYALEEPLVGEYLSVEVPDHSIVPKQGLKVCLQRGALLRDSDSVCSAPIVGVKLDLLKGQIDTLY